MITFRLLPLFFRTLFGGIDLRASIDVDSDYFGLKAIKRSECLLIYILDDHPNIIFSFPGKWDTAVGKRSIPSFLGILMLCVPVKGKSCCFGQAKWRFGDKLYFCGTVLGESSTELIDIFDANGALLSRERSSIRAA